MMAAVFTNKVNFHLLTQDCQRVNFCLLLKCQFPLNSQITYLHISCKIMSIIVIIVKMLISKPMYQKLDLDVDHFLYLEFLLSKTTLCSICWVTYINCCQQFFDLVQLLLLLFSVFCEKSVKLEDEMIIPVKPTFPASP